MYSGAGLVCVPVTSSYTLFNVNCHGASRVSLSALLCSLLEQDVGVRHAGARQTGSPDALHRPVQTAGGGWAAHSVPADRRDPDRGHGREHHGVWTLMREYLFIYTWTVGDASWDGCRYNSKGQTWVSPSMGTRYDYFVEHQMLSLI